MYSRIVFLRFVGLVVVASVSALDGALASAQPSPQASAAEQHVDPAAAPAAPAGG